MEFGKIVFKNGMDKNNINSVVLYGLKSDKISFGYFQHLDMPSFFDFYNGKIIGNKGNKWYGFRVHNFMAGIWL